MLKVSLASANALESHLLQAKDLGPIKVAKYEELVGDLGTIKQMLGAHIRRTAPGIRPGYILRRRTNLKPPSRTDN